MDKLDMMELELPSTEGLDDLDNPNAPAAQAAENAELPETPNADGFNDDDYSYEYEGGSLEDMAAPVLSEMDGSELGTPVAARPKAAANSGAAPVISEMSDMPMNRQRQQGGYSPANNFGGGMSNQTSQAGHTGQPMNMQPGQGGYGQNTYSPVNHSSANPGSFGGQSRTDYWDYMDGDSELVRKGEKIAKVIGTITIVISVLDGIVGLMGLNARIIIAAVYHIYFAVKFKNGSQNSRYWLGVGCILTVISGIMGMFEVSSLTADYAQYGLTWIITVVQIILLIPTVGFGILAYYYLFNKAVKAYCERSGGRGEL